MEGKKKLGEERRNLILNWLKNSNDPLTGQQLAEKMKVSRQVIVQDISLLKAKNEPIIATAQGYVYINDKESNHLHRRIIACFHLPQQTQNELNILVDHGVFVNNVIVEHSIYGELTASLLLKNRRDVQQFIIKVGETKAAYLSELTGGVHLHTIEAETEEQLDEACKTLEKKGFLLSKTE
ncbi:transcription repressor NadR [Tepidibacillus marianensis]|uniref:transcription repressor NadR n=1 Tax=Tepidibacillus marianensis TaxID=3131995 RepID=UPI0030D209BB